MQRPRTLTSPPSLSLSSSSSSSSSNLPGDGDSPQQPILPLEIMEEILCRLPVKLLLQLRCVCKSWNSLISDPKFAKNHLLRSSKNPTRHRLIFSPSRALQFFRAYTFPHLSNVLAAYPLNNPYRDSIVVGSCDGILCITLDEGVGDILLRNPSIQKSKRLPTLECPPREPGFVTDFRDIVYGFGYDHVVDSYKVVAVFRFIREAHVYTLGTDSWRRIGDFPDIVGTDEQGKLVSGSLNWLKCGSSRIIISFDLVKECCQEFSQPDYGRNVEVTLRVFRDCLCIVSNCHRFTDVWIMNEYGNQESWTKLFRVPDNFCLFSKVLYVYEHEEVLLKFKSCVLVYNYRNGTTRSPDTECSTQISDEMVPNCYIESLISPCL